MKYIALLRGINISGKNKISMNDLKLKIEQLGFKDAITYLNSGNVIFTSNIDNKDVIKNNIQLMIKNEFNLDIPIYIVNAFELKELLDNCPTWWGKEEKEIYSNIIFIIPPITSNEVINTIGDPNEYEKIKEYKNNIFWSYSLKDYRKTNWWSKTANANISNKITIRTASTMRKILKICNRTEME